ASLRLSPEDRRPPGLGPTADPASRTGGTGPRGQRGQTVCGDAEERPAGSRPPHVLEGRCVPVLPLVPIAGAVSCPLVRWPNDCTPQRSGIPSTGGGSTANGGRVALQIVGPTEQGERVDRLSV